MKKIVLTGAIVLVITAFFLFDLNAYLTLDGLKSSLAEFRHWQQQSQLLTGLLFFLFRSLISLSRTTLKHLPDRLPHLERGVIPPLQTMVVYMGLNGLATLCRELVAHGLPDSTPAAIVSQATTPAQRVLAGTLASLPGIAERERPRAPMLIVVGQVVVLREQLAWFTPQQAT